MRFSLLINLRFINVKISYILKNRREENFEGNLKEIEDLETRVFSKKREF